MSTATVTTQTELDEALTDDSITSIRIESERGVWLRLTATPANKTVRAGGSATVRAWDSATVEAGDSATVRAWGSATVRAGGSATVEAWDSATVRAGGSATVRAWDSATVRAWGSATVRAGGSATVEAWDSATVRAWGSATVRAWDSATVEAWDSATVRAGGSATVRAWDSATVEAGSHVAVHLHSGTCQISGGVIIDHTAVDQDDPATWCAYHGVTVDGDHAVLYKAVRSNWESAHGTNYQPGTVASCGDFRADGECGGGLHVSPTPSQAKTYDDDATRFVEVRVLLAGLNPIGGDKAKAAEVECVREVDEFARSVPERVSVS